MVFFWFVAVSGLFWLIKRANFFARLSELKVIFKKKNIDLKKLEDQNDKNSYKTLLLTNIGVHKLSLKAKGWGKQFVCLPLTTHKIL